jgi:hypothetical protein
MPNSWKEALFGYRYPFDLSKYVDSGNYPGWFTFSSDSGERAGTMEFEAHFRSHAPEFIEPWLEVVFWKIYSQPTGRGDKLTRRAAKFLAHNSISATSLWEACNCYIEKPTKINFNEFRRLLGLSSQAIAVAATFASFARPDLFPMIDTRIAKWVGKCFHLHNAADPFGPQLIRPLFDPDKQSVITMEDFPFLASWICWCRYTAKKLSDRTSLVWRARDVEMAVFHAWGGRHDPHPRLTLKPIVSL